MNLNGNLKTHVGTAHVPTVKIYISFEDNLTNDIVSFEQLDPDHMLCSVASDLGLYFALGCRSIQIL